MCIAFEMVVTRAIRGIIRLRVYQYCIKRWQFNRLSAAKSGSARQTEVSKQKDILKKIKLLQMSMLYCCQNKTK